MNSQILETYKSAKLLGVTFDAKLNFSEHIKNTLSQLVGRIYGMRELNWLGLNAASLKLHVYYSAYVRSVLMYAFKHQALKIMNSDIEYSEAIQIYDLPPVKQLNSDLAAL